MSIFWSECRRSPALGTWCETVFLCRDSGAVLRRCRSLVAIRSTLRPWGLTRRRWVWSRRSPRGVVRVQATAHSPSTSQSMKIVRHPRTMSTRPASSACRGPQLAGQITTVEGAPVEPGGTS